MNRALIGVDCATQARKVGLALGRMEGEIIVVLDAQVGTKDRAPADIVVEWLSREQPALLALDAPLGWPVALGGILKAHHAGEPIGPSPDSLFHRRTDDDIRRRFGKRPLEVGAALIARTAYAALAFLGDVRRRTGLEIPLAWQASDLTGTSVIEVYPAATLAARGAKNSPDCLTHFEPVLQLPVLPILSTSDHARDAVLCLIAAADFLGGRCPEPDDIDSARREGWIWASRAGVYPL